MSFWTPKKKFRIVLWVIQILIIFILSWIISSNFLWSADDGYEQTTQKYFEAKSQYFQSNIAEDREQFFDNTLEYATSSVDQMINHSSGQRLIVENFTWLGDEEKLTITSFIDEEIQYLEDGRNQILLAENENEIKELFVPIYKNWASFRYEMTANTKRIFASAVLKSCERISETDDLSIVDSDLELRKYTEFVSSCEDWAVKDVDVSSKMLEWIKVVE